MFFIADLDRDVIIHPSFFDSTANEKVKEKLRSDVEGQIIGTMIIVAIISIQEPEPPKLVPGTGNAKFNLQYRAVVWRPFRGEVVDGLVKSVVSNGIFVDVGGMGVFVSRAMIPKTLRYSVDASTPAFTDGTEQSIERGVQVRLRIKGIRGELGAIFAIGSIGEDYLGALLQ